MREFEQNQLITICAEICGGTEFIMEAKIIEIIAEYQDRDESEYTADQTFTEMGLDSLDLAELILQLEDELGADIDINPSYNTPAKLAKYIASIK